MKKKRVSRDAANRGYAPQYKAPSFIALVCITIMIGIVYSVTRGAGSGEPESERSVEETYREPNVIEIFRLDNVNSSDDWCQSYVGSIRDPGSVREVYEAFRALPEAPTMGLSIPPYIITPLHFRSFRLSFYHGTTWMQQGTVTYSRYDNKPEYHRVGGDNGFLALLAQSLGISKKDLLEARDQLCRNDGRL